MVLEPVIGAARFLYFAAALSVFLILLSVLPTDSTLIRLLAYLGCAVLFMGSSACVLSVYSGSWGHQVWLGYLAAVGGYAHTAAFARLLPWRGRLALPARQTLPCNQRTLCPPSIPNKIHRAGIRSARMLPMRPTDHRRNPSTH